MNKVSLLIKGKKLALWDANDKSDFTSKIQNSEKTASTTKNLPILKHFSGGISSDLMTIF